MSGYLLYNDSFHKSDSPLVSADNRGLRYGDGLFETLKYSDGKIHLAELHFERLFSGLETLAFELPARLTPTHLAGQVAEICKKNGHNNSARVRINIFRGNGGLYDAENHFPNTIIQSWPLETGFQLNENGLVTGLYRDAQKAMDKFSNLKSNNYMSYAMAALHAKKQQWNDAFLLNAAGRVCDSSIANVFVVKDQVAYTCPLTEGCIAGVMRKFLLASLPGHNFKCQEKNLTEEDLYAADEIFLTNAIKGIRWVSHCGDSSYTNQLTQKIFDKLLKKT